MSSFYVCIGELADGLRNPFAGCIALYKAFFNGVPDAKRIICAGNVEGNGIMLAKAADVSKAHLKSIG